MSDIVQKVGSRIRNLRTERRLSQAALAERAGLATHTVSRIERGSQAPSLVALEQLATGLGVALPELVDVEHHGAAGRDPVDTVMAQLPDDAGALRAKVRVALEGLLRG